MEKGAVNLRAERCSSFTGRYLGACGGRRLGGLFCEEKSRGALKQPAAEGRRGARLTEGGKASELGSWRAFFLGKTVISSKAVATCRSIAWSFGKLR